MWGEIRHCGHNIPTEGLIGRNFVLIEGVGVKIQRIMTS